MKKAPTVDGRCGTPAGYQRHLNAGEVACGPCREAMRECGRRNRPSVSRKVRQPVGIRSERVAAGPVVLPREVPEDAHKSPCVDPRNNYIWDPQNDGERAPAVRMRWREAARLCITECPVFAHCAESRVLAGGEGVWAGRIPEVTS